MNATLKTKLAKINEQITKLTKERDALQTKLDSIFDPSTISTGDTITFTNGRGESKAPATGLVIGVKDDKFRVAIGAGFDATVLTITADKVTAIQPKVE